jgi:hypothetical protein
MTSMLKALLLGTCTAAFLAGCAAAPRAPDTVVSSTAAAPRFNCLTTGTRIPLKQGECANAPGRVFTQDDLQRTGATTASEALRMLDPSFTR